MGQRKILVSGWRLVVLLLIGTLAIACEGQNPTAGTSSPESEPLLTASPDAASPPNPGPPPPPQGAFLAQLPPEQTSQLTTLGVDVVAPGAVPPAFSVVDIRTEQPVTEAGGPDTGSSYLIVYQDPTNRCFAVEFAADGIGDPPATENRLPIQPPLFGDQGYGLNYGSFQDAGMRAQFPGSNLYSDWLMGPTGAYRLIGSAYIGSLFPDLAGCEDIAPAEAMSIVESFTVITPEVMGDG